MRGPPRYDVPKKAPGSLRLVQEFLNTADKEHGREWLDTPDAVRRWFSDRGLLGSSRVRRADVDRTHQVREALRALVRANSAPTRNTQARRLLDRVADEARITIRFDETGGARLETGARGHARALGQLLLCAVAAMSDGHWGRLKTCPNCSWAFYDYSRNGSAKWCSMILCGNRSKTRSYYRRRRGENGHETVPRQS